MRTPSFFLLLLALVNLTAPRARACTADKYGKCGEQPPKTDRYDKPAPKPKPPAKIASLSTTAVQTRT